MKNTKSSKKKKKKTRSTYTWKPEVNTNAENFLRTLEEQEAFHFFEAIGKPTGDIARSLSDFLDKVKYVKSESLIFHLQRRDFQTWINKTLGDSKLAERLDGITYQNTNDVRMSIYEAIENRLKEIEGLSTTIIINENKAVIQP